MSRTLIMRGEMPAEVRNGLAAVLRHVRSDCPRWQD